MFKAGGNYRPFPGSMRGSAGELLCLESSHELTGVHDLGPPLFGLNEALSSWHFE